MIRGQGKSMDFFVMSGHFRQQGFSWTAAHTFCVLHPGSYSSLSLLHRRWIVYRLFISYLLQRTNPLDCWKFNDVVLSFFMFYVLQQTCTKQCTFFCNVIKDLEIVKRGS